MRIRKAGLRYSWFRSQPWVDWGFGLGLSSWSGLRVISGIVVIVIAGRCGCRCRCRRWRWRWLGRGSKPGIDRCLGRGSRCLVGLIQSEGARIRPSVVVVEWHLDVRMKNAESHRLAWSEGSETKDVMVSERWS